MLRRIVRRTHLPCWRCHDGKDRIAKEWNMLAAIKATLIMLAILIHSAAQAQDGGREGPAWQTFSVPQSGLRVQYPSGIFSVAEGKAAKGVGERFSRGDGRSQLSIYSRPNEAGDSPASYLRNNLKIPRSVLTYHRVTRSFFAIASPPGGFDPVQPVQFFLLSQRRDPLHRPRLSADGETRLGRHRDADQPFAAAAGRLGVRHRAPVRHGRASAL